MDKCKTAVACPRDGEHPAQIEHGLLICEVIGVDGESRERWNDAELDRGATFQQYAGFELEDQGREVGSILRELHGAEAREAIFAKAKASEGSSYDE